MVGLGIMGFYSNYVLCDLSAVLEQPLCKATPHCRCVLLAEWLVGELDASDCCDCEQGAAGTAAQPGLPLVFGGGASVELTSQSRRGS